MTRRRDLMLEDLTGCTHQPETPVCDDAGTEILYWLCRCGKRHESGKTITLNTSNGVFHPESAFESALYKEKK